MKLTLTLLLLLICGAQVSAQVAVSYFPFQSLLTISSNTEKLFFADYKIETNTFLSNINMEISPKINWKRSAGVNYYFGAGISFNPANAASDLTVTNGYFVDAGARIKPFANKRIQIVFEVSPYFNKDFNGGNLRTRLGMAYNFGK